MNNITAEEFITEYEEMLIQLPEGTYDLFMNFPYRFRVEGHPTRFCLDQGGPQGAQAVNVEIRDGIFYDIGFGNREERKIGKLIRRNDHNKSQD